MTTADARVIEFIAELIGAGIGVATMSYGRGFDGRDELEAALTVLCAQIGVCDISVFIPPAAQ